MINKKNLLFSFINDKRGELSLSLISPKSFRERELAVLFWRWLWRLIAHGLSLLSGFGIIRPDLCLRRRICSTVVVRLLPPAFSSSSPMRTAGYSLRVSLALVLTAAFIGFIPFLFRSMVFVVSNPTDSPSSIRKSTVCWIDWRRLSIFFEA